jgi:hypothetical protein
MSEFEKIIDEEYGMKVQKENEEIKRLKQENEMLKKMARNPQKEEKKE